MRSISLLAAFCAALLTSSAARAQPLTITSAHPDAASHTLVINGTGFRAGVAVAVEGRDLTVTSVRPQQITASLPSLSPGTYRLIVRTWYDTARFVVSVDAVPGATPVEPTPALTVVAGNGNVLGTLVGVTKLFGTDPAMVARQDNGVWVTFAVDSNGVMAGSYPMFYSGDGCSGDAFAYLESSPAPLVRSVQRMTASDLTVFYPGNPPQTRSFPSMEIEDPANPGTKLCVSAPDNGWGGLLNVGPLRTIDVSAYPAPFSVR